MARNNKPYYTLIGFRNSDRKAEILFGDPHKHVVKEEMDTAQYDNRSTTHRRSERYYHSFKILTSDIHQKAIDEAVKAAEIAFQAQFQPFEELGSPNPFDIEHYEGH